MAKKIFVDEEKLSSSILNHNSSVESHKDIRNGINNLLLEKAPKNNPEFTGSATLNGNNLATTNKTDILFPYNEGYTRKSPYGGSIVKNSFGEVTLNIGIDGTFQANGDIGNIIGVLPPGYRPTTFLRGRCDHFKLTKNAPTFMIRQNGEVLIFVDEPSTSISMCVKFDSV